MDALLRILTATQLLFILATGVWLVLGAQRAGRMPSPLPLAGGGCLAALAVVTVGVLVNLMADAAFTPGLAVVTVGLLPCTAVTLVAVRIATR